jgi:hypothetical protein
MALFGELPLAAFCLWIAGRVEYHRQRHATVMTEILHRLHRRAAPDGPGRPDDHTHPGGPGKA